MNRSTVAAATLAVAIFVIGMPAGAPSARADSESSRVPATQAAPAQPPPVYIPPRRGAPTEVAPAATRGVQGPKLKLLAPDHVGLTVSPRPTLYMYVAEPGRIQVIVTLAANPGAAPLATGRVDVTNAPSIAAFSLGETGTNLEPGVDYRISLALFNQGSTIRATESVLLRHLAPPLELDVMTAGATPAAKARTYASAGIWFDAIDAISNAIAAAPAAPGPRRDRAALLEQVGLSEIAGLDLKAAAKH